MSKQISQGDYLQPSGDCDPAAYGSVLPHYGAVGGVKNILWVCLHLGEWYGLNRLLTRSNVERDTILNQPARRSTYSRQAI